MARKNFFLATMFVMFAICKPSYANIDINVAVEDLKSAMKDVCNATGGFFVDNKCHNLAVATTEQPDNSLLEGYEDKIEDFKTRCEKLDGKYSKQMIDAMQTAKITKHYEHTCWFDDLTGTSGNNAKLLQRCKEITNTYDAWKGRVNKNGKTERGCFLNTPSQQKN